MSATTPRPARTYILDIPHYKAGKSSLKARQDTPIIKLSSNENPFGPSAKAIAAMQDAAAMQHRYPDQRAAALRETLGKKYNIPPEQIVCGAGSDELLNLLCEIYAGPGDEVLYTEHGFLIYPIAATRAGATPVKVLEHDKKADIHALLDAVTDNTRLVFIASPNNPTGSYLTRDELEELRAKLPAHILLVLDAAYAEYATQDDYTDGLSMALELPNVVMTRTFSKIYGLGSLRLGWMVAHPDIISLVDRMRAPFNVSGMAQMAGIAALQDTAFEQQTRDHNTVWRDKLAEELSALGFIAYPSAANFLLVEFGSEEAVTKALNHLEESGILVRKVAVYGLPTCLRITIGTEQENLALLTSLSTLR